MALVVVFASISWSGDSWARHMAAGTRRTCGRCRSMHRHVTGSAQPLGRIIPTWIRQGFRCPLGLLEVEGVVEGFPHFGFREVGREAVRRYVLAFRLGFVGRTTRHVRIRFGSIRPEWPLVRWRVGSWRVGWWKFAVIGPS